MLFLLFGLLFPLSLIFLALCLAFVIIVVRSIKEEQVMSVQYSVKVGLFAFDSLLSFGFCPCFVDQ